MFTSAPERTRIGGWTVRRLQVIDDAAGLCALCGLPGADTATRGWSSPGWTVPGSSSAGWSVTGGDAHELVAAHTRCVVGLGPPVTAPRAHLRAA